MRQYIGARYVTKIYENSLDPSSAEWEASVNYEPLTMVTYNNGSYLSKKEVPAAIGDPASNPTYWVQTGFYNGQIIYLQSEIDDINDAIGDINNLETLDKTKIVNAINEVNKKIGTPEEYGAKGDGVTDDTAAINTCLANCGYVLFKSGSIYMIDPDVSLNPISDQTLDLNGATLKAIPNSLDRYEIINIDGISNVIVKNGIIVGDRDEHTGATGEWGYGISIDTASSDILIDNVAISECWGDGICIQHGSANITVRSCHLDHNSRNGITVGESTNVIIDGNIIERTDRTNPKAGIDVEPDDGETAENVIISHNIIKNNGVYGIHSYGGTNYVRVKNLMITDNEIINDATTKQGIYITYVDKPVIQNNSITGTHSVHITGYALKYAKITGNYCAGTANSVSLYLLESTHCYILNNVLRGITLPNGPAIKFVGVLHSEIKNNVLDECTVTGAGLIYLMTDGGQRSEHNMFTNNSIHYCTASFCFSFAGESNSNRMEFNKIIGTFTYTFYRESSTPSYNSIYFNDVKSGSSGITGYGGDATSYGGALISNVIDDSFVA